MPLAEHTLFIFDHLEGPTKNEIKYRERVDREIPEQIFWGAQLYGCPQSYIALQQKKKKKKIPETT